MLGVMLCSRWSALLGRMISMHQIFSRPRHQKQRRTAQQEIKKTASPAAKDRHFNRVQLVTAKPSSTQSRPALEPEASAALREKLTVELEGIGSREEAANWAHRVLHAKNSLTTADAKHVEQAFLAKLTILGSEPQDQLTSWHEGRRMRQPRTRRRSAVIDKTVLAPITRCIAPAMKRPGGQSPGSIRRPLLVPYSCKHIHCQ